ncbi:hypothetical protein KPL71_021118 [Citrus sinensis]|uniref:Uncharacterized protein n=1 Tax=Citrus sinensis TaxID=2711 RepID=A0ACB8JDE0_CITSI|nr:hypothetical protein KPL71_021118 [Citrus sinensis]
MEEERRLAAREFCCSPLTCVCLVLKLCSKKWLLCFAQNAPFCAKCCENIGTVKYEIPGWRIAKQTPKEETTKSGDDDALFCLTKHIDPNSTSSIINNIETSGYDYEDDRFYEKESKNEGAPNKVSAKSKLLEICAANHWKPPLFDCCQEEGPCHRKLFTFKVTFEIESLNTILECFGAPQSKKKTAAEHAAEGALCCDIKFARTVSALKTLL